MKKFEIKFLDVNTRDVIYHTSCYALDKECAVWTALDEFHVIYGTKEEDYAPAIERVCVVFPDVMRGLTCYDVAMREVKIS